MKKLIATLLLSASLAGISVPVLSMSENFIIAKADEERVNPDLTDPLSDLIVVDEFRAKYNLGGYSTDITKDSFDILYALEWVKSSFSDDYSVYFYVFNKSGLGIEKYNFNYSGNRVSIFSEKEQKMIHKNITFVSKTADNAFLKFRLDIDDKTIFKKEDGSRSYGIIGIEIAHYNEVDTEALSDYEIGKKWTFSETSSGVLVAYNSEFNYIPINDLVGDCYEMLFHTDRAENSYGELFYSYFSVPKQINGEEMKLYSVHADYYKFSFQNNLCCLIEEEHDGKLNSLEDYQLMEKNLQAIQDDALKAAKWEEIKSEYQGFSSTGSAGNFLAHAYLDPLHHDFRVRTYDNPFIPENWSIFVRRKNAATSLFDDYTWFKVGNPGSTLYPIPVTYQQYESRVINGNYIGQYLNVEKAEQYTGLSREDAYRNIHYTYDKNPLNDAEYKEYKIVNGINFQLNDAQKWFNKIFYDGEFGKNVIDNVICLEKVNYDDIDLSNSAFGNKYYINDGKVDKFKDYLSDREDEDRDTWIFRFDAGQYYLSVRNVLGYGYLDDYNVWHEYNPAYLKGIGFICDYVDGIVDFDLLELTFVNDAEQLLTIPVVSDPTNIFPNFHFKFNNDNKGCGNSWKTLILILGIVLLVFLVIKIVPLFQQGKTARAAVKANKIAQKERKEERAANIKTAEQLERLNRNLENKDRYYKNDYFNDDRRN